MNTHKIKFDWATWSVAALAVAISMTPRIPLPIVIGASRVLDIRLEDILISIFILYGLFYLILNRRFRFPLALPIFIYVGTGLLSSGLGVVFYGLNPLKAIFYNFKEIEYVLIFLFVANLANGEGALKRVFMALALAGGANILWGFYQIFAGARGVLLTIQLPSSLTHIAGSRYSGYGITTIGEFSPFSTALYFAFISYIFYSWYKSTDVSIWILVAGASASICSFMTGEKISVVLFAFVLIAFNIGKINTFRRFVGILMAFLAFAAIIFSPAMDYKKLSKSFQTGTGIGRNYPSVARIFDKDAYIITTKRSGKRMEQWSKIMEYRKGTIFFGSGKGNMYIDDTGTTEEAHSHYVKTFVETGIFGLLAFLFLALNLVSKFMAAIKSRGESCLRLSGIAALLALGALLIAGVVQDSFKPVLPNALFWLLAGLTLSFRQKNSSKKNPDTNIS